MAYEQKDNSGSMFTNTRKETDSHPDRTGSATIAGKAYWVSGWIKQDKNGKPWLSLAFKPKDGKPAQPPRPSPSRQPARADLDDEIPF